jgi:hypothetical protein
MAKPTIALGVKVLVDIARRIDLVRGFAARRGGKSAISTGIIFVRKVRKRV